MSLCLGVTKAGKPCLRNGKPENGGYCHQHSQLTEVTTQKAGGGASAGNNQLLNITKQKAPTVSDIVKQQQQETDNVETDELSEMIPTTLKIDARNIENHVNNIQESMKLIFTRIKTSQCPTCKLYSIQIAYNRQWFNTCASCGIINQ